MAAGGLSATGGHSLFRITARLKATSDCFSFSVRFKSVKKRDVHHSLRWIHAQCTLNKLIAPNEEKRQILEEVLKQVWDFYDDLKAYKKSPDQTKKIELEKRFDAISNQQTGYQMLNLALKRLYENKAELLLA